MGSDTYSKKTVSELSLNILGHKIWTNFHIALMLWQLLSDRRLRWAIMERLDSFFSYIWRPEVLWESTMSKEKHFFFLKKLDTVEIPVPRNSMAVFHYDKEALGFGELALKLPGGLRLSTLCRTFS